MTASGSEPTSSQLRPVLGSGLAWATAGVLLWLMGYPLLLTLLEALAAEPVAGKTPVGESPLAFTLDHFREFVSREDEWLALWRSLWISLASVVLAGAVGIPLAFVFERTDFPGRRVLGALMALPVALPPLVGVIAFLFLYGESGFVSRSLQMAFGLEQAPWRLHGAGAILLVHTYSMYVYFFLFVRAALARLDGSMLEAAASLGAGRGRILLRVILPQLRPAILGAALLTFMTSLGSFSAPYIFGGGFRVMTTQIVASKVSGQLALAQVEAVFLASLAILALGSIRLLQGPDAVASAHGIAPERRRLASPAARVGFALVGWGLAAFMLLPHLTLVLISFVPTGTWTTELLPPELSTSNYRELFSEPERLRPMLNSLWMATLATAGAVLLGLTAARQSLRQARLGRRRLGALLEGLVALPWAIPGTVFALALATAFGVHAPHLLRFLWVGTAVILPLAYLVRALPITGRSALAGLRQLDPALEEAASSLGAGRLRRMLRVVLPMVWPSVVAGLGLAFITALGDFVTSIVLYTYTTRPISIEIASALRVQEFGIAAAYGVLLMLLSSAAFLAWGRGEDRGSRS
ncbi:MAG: iron ABC transporter permease [Holophagales bacterium]|nr:iron ABC transporter permease [Holophagales bacterium]